MPGIVLATGFFLLLNNTIGLPESADGIVIFTNALMAILCAESTGKPDARHCRPLQHAVPVAGY